MSSYVPSELVAHVRREVVGMERVAEVLAVGLATGRHTVIEGPPGTGKSTLLRSLATAAGTELRFVEGNAELTPARLLGHFDPALVLEQGYRADAFVPGPLADAMQHGHLLYLEELNRIPEESLNVLITALAEGELHVPRYGRVQAHHRFRLIAAMNPFDAIGTARIGQAVYDRLCRVVVDYQDADQERTIVSRVTGASPTTMDVDLGVTMVRASRSHRDVRIGSSVRGAIDFALLAHGLRTLRGSADDQRSVLLDAAYASLSGRIRLDEATDRTPEDVIAELLDQALADWRKRMSGAADAEKDPGDDPGKEERPTPSPPGDQGRGRILTGEEARKAVAEAGRRTASRNELTARHDSFDRASPEVGSLDQSYVEELAGASPDEAFALLADLANATDPALRAAARRVAAQVFLRLARLAGTPRRGIRTLELDDDLTAGDLDLDASLARSDGLHPARHGGLLVRRWSASERAICLLVDRSGSMSGVAVARAALGAASVVVAAGDRGDCSVITFARDAIVLQEQGRRRKPEDVLNDILTLRGRGETDLSLALRAARRELAKAGAQDRVVVLLSDTKATTGSDPVAALTGIDRLHVLCPSDDPQAVTASRELAQRGGGRCEVVTDVAGLPSALNRLLEPVR